MSYFKIKNTNECEHFQTYSGYSTMEKFEDLPFDKNSFNDLTVEHVSRLNSIFRWKV